MYFILPITHDSNICLILIRPMLFEHGGQTRMRSEYKKEQIPFKQQQSVAVLLLGCQSGSVEDHT